jgi:chemotaxis protein MotB
MFIVRSLALSLAALALAGCVSSGRYRQDTESLQSKLNDEAAAKSACQARTKDLNENLIKAGKDKGLLKASLDEMNKAMDEMKSRQAAERKRLQEFADLSLRFKKLTDSGALSVKMIGGKMVVSLGSDVLFPAGSARLSKDGVKAMKEVSAQLSAIADKKYQVEGHTDNQPISTATFPSNWELASARSIAVVKTMIENGMTADRVSSASYSDTQPVQPNDSVEGRAANRRVAIVVVPDLSSLPGYEELQKMSQ